MKIIFKLFLVLLSFVYLSACSSNSAEEKQNEETTQTETTSTDSENNNKEEKYGAEITLENAIAVSEIPAILAKQDSADLKVVGKIGECCQKKGCWMKVPVSENQEMFVRFKDYGFFVPMDSEGKEIVMEGKVKKEVISASQLRHYAEDAGKSKEEIEKITEDEVRISFMATGVIIKG
jgi:membrane-bound lytic murein transglycosylase